MEGQDIDLRRPVRSALSSLGFTYIEYDARISLLARRPNNVSHNKLQSPPPTLEVNLTALVCDLVAIVISLV